jgi:lipopolysaccharide transport system permease protein
MLLNDIARDFFNGPACRGHFRPLSRPDITSANLHLLRELIRRDITARFTGSALGLSWAILQPLSLVVLYWFVFTYMLPGGRLGIEPGAGGDQPYIYFLITGLLPWLAISEGLMRSATSIVDNASIVRRLPLRSEILVVVPNASALAFQGIGLGITVVAYGFSGGSLRQLWLLPVALAFQFFLQLGIGMLLAGGYVFFRDLTQVVGFVLSVVFYLSPILYPVTGRFAAVFFWNPLTPLFGLFRSAILGAPLPEASSIVFLLTATLAAVLIGRLALGKVQPTSADLI